MRVTQNKELMPKTLDEIEDIIYDVCGFLPQVTVISDDRSMIQHVKLSTQSHYQLDRSILENIVDRISNKHHCILSSSLYDEAHILMIQIQYDITLEP